MGFAASQARQLMLTARKSDLELTLQFIQQARMQLANMTSALFSQGANLDPNSAQAKWIESQTAGIQQKDKVMEMQSQTITNQHDAVQTELDAVSKVIQKNVESTFKLMG